MVIMVDKNATPETIAKALNKLQKTNKKSLRSFYGKLKGAFGDALEYQKSMRG
jgi:hypothetical protein